MLNPPKLKARLSTRLLGECSNDVEGIPKKDNRLHAPVSYINFDIEAQSAY